MRAYYIGNFAAPYSTENEIRLAFESLGWDVDAHQEADFMTALDTERGRALVADRAVAADLVLHTMTQGQYPDTDATVRLWNLCAQRGIPTASMHLDLFYGIGAAKRGGVQRRHLPAQHPMFRVAHVFTPDGSHDHLWKRDGVNHHWLPPGVGARWCYDATPMPSQYLVGFAGSDRYHVEWPHRGELLAHLRDWYGDRFVHLGGTSTPRVNGEDLNRWYRSVPVWVGDSCLTAPDFRYWSDRVPETWGRGGFLIHPRVDALNERALQLTGEQHPGWQWECGDWRTLRDLITSWITAEVPRLHMQELMTTISRKRDTYVDRVCRVLNEIGLDE